MLVYEYEKNDEVLTEEQYNELTKLAKYRENDSDFEAHEFEFLNDFGDYDLYTEVEDGNEFNCVLVKFHQNVNQKDRIFLVNQSDTKDIEELASEYDDADDGDEKWTILSGIEDRLGLN